MKKTDLPYSLPTPVATLHGEQHFKLAPDAEARARMAAALDLDGIESLNAHLKVTQAASGLVTIEGQLDARYSPVCVVSLEPFEQTISAPVALKLAPEGLIEKMTKRAEENGDADFEPPDPILEGSIDLGAIVTEFLALELDPYPKKPGAKFAGGDPVEPEVSPFSALAALKRKDS